MMEKGGVEILVSRIVTVMIGCVTYHVVSIIVDNLKISVIR